MSLVYTGPPCLIVFPVSGLMPGFSRNSSHFSRVPMFRARRLRRSVGSEVSSESVDVSSEHSRISLLYVGPPSFMFLPVEGLVAGSLKKAEHFSSEVMDCRLEGQAAYSEASDSVSSAHSPRSRVCTGPPVLMVLPVMGFFVGSLRNSSHISFDVRGRLRGSASPHSLRSFLNAGPPYLMGLPVAGFTDGSL
ncbi:unknown [Singapore grouper iridovirus]|uniref:Uncharacterized protein n=1 Tax=Singapore grouper iridovirus TaxID=262968 RepID=Q5YFM5_9VIRU|nr:hypothetical protein ORF040R [Singapore grouper iridovirus]AAS18055.1 unknown [Singapore grouper iridovirus]WAU86749.1 hypothetical protein ORF040R [Singapore grouper iridovirus]